MPNNKTSTVKYIKILFNMQTIVNKYMLVHFIKFLTIEK